jgi:DNA-binding GntR family transcriptional regulator
MAGATAPLLGLQKRSLREQALAALRAAITSGELVPGRHLVETELSEMLQISRGTLREALRQLEQEGLLSAGPRGRLSVRHLDAKEIRDIYSVRAALESLAARTLCELPDRQHAIASLKTAIEAMAAAEMASMQERVESDLEFHRTLCRLTGNESGCPSCSRARTRAS